MKHFRWLALALLLCAPAHAQQQVYQCLHKIGADGSNQCTDISSGNPLPTTAVLNLSATSFTVSSTIVSPTQGGAVLITGTVYGPSSGGGANPVTATIASPNGQAVGTGSNPLIVSSSILGTSTVTGSVYVPNTVAISGSVYQANSPWLITGTVYGPAGGSSANPVTATIASPNGQAVGTGSNPLYTSSSILGTPTVTGSVYINGGLSLASTVSASIITGNGQQFGTVANPMVVSSSISGPLSAGAVIVTVSNTNVNVANGSPVTIVSNSVLNTISGSVYTLGTPTITGSVYTLKADPCDALAKTNVNISQTIATKIISASASNKIYYCSVNIVGSDAEKWAFVEGSGTVCGTSSTIINGGAANSSTVYGPSYPANGGLTYGNGRGAVIKGTNTNYDGCIWQSGGSLGIYGNVTYVQAP